MCEDGRSTWRNTSVFPRVATGGGWCSVTDDDACADSGESDRAADAEGLPLDRRQFLQATSGSLLGGAGVSEGIAAQDSAVGPTVYVCSQEGILYAVDATEGTERWRFEKLSQEFNFSPTVVDGVVYAAGFRTLYAVDAASGNKRWEFSPRAGIESSPTVVDDVVYVGSGDGTLYAVNDDGTEKWQYDTESRIDRSTPTVADGVVYVASTDGNLHAVNADGGTQKGVNDESQNWPFTEPEEIRDTSPTVADGIVCVGSRDETLYAVDAADGMKMWEYDEAVSQFVSSPTVADGVVYVASEKIHAVDTSDGSQEWTFGLPSITESSPTVADGVVYIGSEDDNLYAVDAADGTELGQNWPFSQSSSDIESSPTVADGVVYVGSKDETLYAVNAVDGSQKWAFTQSPGPGKSNGQIRSSPTVVRNPENGSSVGSRVKLRTLGHHDRIETTMPSISISGKITDLGENPVPGADVSIYHWPEPTSIPQLISTTETDTDGKWEFTSSKQVEELRSQYSGSIICLGKKSGWFDAQKYNAEMFFDQSIIHDQTLSREFLLENEHLLGPISNHTNNGSYYGTVSIWRAFESEDTSRQSVRALTHTGGNLNGDSALKSGFTSIQVPENINTSIQPSQPNEISSSFSKVVPIASTKANQALDRGNYETVFASHLFNPGQFNQQIDTDLHPAAGTQYLVNDIYARPEQTGRTAQDEFWTETILSIATLGAGQLPLGQAGTALSIAEAIAGIAKAAIDDNDSNQSIERVIRNSEKVSGPDPNKYDTSVFGFDRDFMSLLHGVTLAWTESTPEEFDITVRSIWKNRATEIAGVDYVDLVFLPLDPTIPEEVTFDEADGFIQFTYGATLNRKPSLPGKAPDDDPRLDRTLIIEGQGVFVQYEFTVSGEVEQVDGTLEGQSVSKQSTDEINGSTVDGGVAGGADGFRFSGELTDLSVDNRNRVTVLVDGEERTFGEDSRDLSVDQSDVSSSVTPLSYNNQTVEEFYGYEDSTSNTPTGVEKSDTSRLFLYDGPEGLSLVVIHDKANNGPRGEVRSAEFDFSGLPTDTGSWVVRDDTEGGNFTRDDTSPSWTWYSNGTDGGAFRGGLNEGFDIEITPAFDGITDWEFLSGDPSDPDVIRLNIDESVKITDSG
jgi:outer membrane protein assembly factor BamB